LIRKGEKKFKAMEDLKRKRWRELEKKNREQLFGKDGEAEVSDPKGEVDWGTPDTT